MGINSEAAHDPVDSATPVAVTLDIHEDFVGADGLQKRPAHFRGLASLSPDWYWETDEQDRFLYVQQVGHGHKLIPSLDVSGKTRREIAVDADEPSLLECFAAVARRKPFRDVSYAVKGLPAGSIRHACVSGEPLYEDGIFKGYVGVGRYIAREVEAADELAQLAEENRALVENSLDVIALLDSSGRFLRINEAALEILGYRPAELLGRQYGELLHPDEQQTVASVDAGLRTGQSTTQDMENRWVKKDGSIIYVSVSVRWSERTQLMHATARDVTERYRTQNELHKSKVELNAMLESIGDAFFAVNSEWHITYMNRKAARFVGANREDCIGKLLLDVVPDLLSSPALPHYQRAMETRETALFETYWEPSGVWVEVRVYPNEGGISVYFHDVTAKRETENALRKSEHRFRNLFERAGDSIFIADRNMRIIDANARACEALGYTEDEMLQLSVMDINIGFDYPTSMLAHLRSGLPQLLEVVKKRKDGTSFPAEMHISRFEDDGKEFFQAIVRDLTEREEAQRNIRESDQRIREVIEMTPAGYFVADSKSVILDVNPALCCLSGFQKAELVGQKLTKLFSFPPWEGGAFAKGGPTSTRGTEAVVKHRNGNDLLVLFNGSIKRDGDGNAECVTGFMTDITARKQAESLLEQLATHDTLTGLPNRALLNERLEQMLKHGPRNSTIAVMFIDLDRFKEVNDSFGHELGDTLLCEVAGRLQRALRPSDVVARLGGDEFVVAAYCNNGSVSAAGIAQKLLSVLATPVTVGGNDVIIGASIGISMFPKDAQTKEVLFQSADTAMYQAKAGGRNGYCFFEAEMTVASKSRMALELSLRPALALKEFELHYQPRIDLKTMSLVGMEALIRWNHPELGQVSPVQFIPIAEDTGLIEPIGQWVLEEACKQTRRLMEEFSRPLMISVNVSVRQLRSRSFVDQVQAVIKKTDFPAHFLELELTESALIEDIERTAGMLRELKNLGLKLAIDDFGTGYSALAYLRKFPIDVLKLDRSFVLQEDEGVSSHQFIKAFVDMAHALNLSVVAEGIETIEVLDFLRATDCDEAQGYLFARPLTLAALETYISTMPFAEKSGELVSDDVELEVSHEALLTHDADMADTQRSAKIGSWQWDASTDVTLASPELCRIFGREDFPLLAQQCDVLFPHAAWLKLNQAMEEVLRTGIGYNLELPALHVEGNEIWVNTGSEVVIGAGGKVIGMRGMMQDITERKRAESIVRNERFVRALTDAMPGMVGYWDKELRCRFANQAYMTCFGKASEEIIGGTMKELMGGPLFALNEPYILGALAGERQRFERALTNADGCIGYTMANYVPDIDGHGIIAGFYVLVTDVTPFKEAETELKLANHVYQNTLNAVMVTDFRGIILSVNPAFNNITGYTAEEAIGQTPRLLRSNRHEKEFHTSVWRQISDTGQWEGEIWDRRKNGEVFLAWQTITRIPDLVGDAGRYVSVFHDITEAWSKNESIKHLAFHDALTDLPNRTLLMERLERHIALAKRDPRSLSVMFLDLDRFKFVNDNLGHEVGDDLLISVAHKLKALVRESDTVARLGGDEFVILLDNPASRDQVEQISNRIIATINQPMEVRGKTAQVGTSIGIAMYPADADSAAQLIKSADSAMYEAKMAGKNTFRFFS